MVNRFTCILRRFDRISKIKYRLGGRIIFCKINSSTILGLRAFPISVEVDISNGLPGFSMVGLLSSEVREARERVRTAIKNSGFTIPPKRVTVNLSPADIRKEGAYFDLPIAIAILASLGMVPASNIQDSMFIGELGLDGSIRVVRGVLGIAAMAKEKGIQRIYVPAANSKEGVLIKEMEVVGVKTLKEIISMLNNPELIQPEYGELNKQFYGKAYKEGMEGELDFKDVSGQEAAIRATEIAAAGMHNILYIGMPGSGKSMIAKRIPSILPDLTFDEAMEVTKIYSALGMLNSGGIIHRRPFRAPHHTITPQALVGGGRRPKPGEITMAHKGVLFLDELPEYDRKTVETLRQPLEERKVTINREEEAFEFPADFMMAAAMNPCMCGYYPDKGKCDCQEYEVRKYLSRLRGALFDRIDICVQLPKPGAGDLQGASSAESSRDIRRRVEKAIKIQRKRFKGTNTGFNSRLKPEGIKKYCKLEEKELELLADSYNKLELSPRVYHKIIKVSRTIADLDGEENIGRRHLLEAMAYRNVLSLY